MGLCFVTGLYAQKPLSQAAIQDFAKNLFFDFRYGDDNIKQLINYPLSREGYEYEYAVTVVENVGTSKVYREVMLKSIYDAYKNREGIFNFLYSLEMIGNNATEIADYTFQKYSKEEKIEEDKERKDAIEASKRYQIDHADEIRAADSLRKIQEDIDAKNKLERKEEAKKEAFLNATPGISNVINSFDSSEEKILSFLSLQGYVHIRDDKEIQVYQKQGAVDNNFAVLLLFKKDKLKSFSFNFRSDNNKYDNIVDTLHQLGFSWSSSSGSGLQKYPTIAVYRNLKKMKCRITKYSDLKEYILSLTFFN
jgi:hypothetical protein